MCPCTAVHLLHRKSLETSCISFYILLLFVGAVAIVTCAAEFNPQMAQVVKARPSDDFELSEV